MKGHELALDWTSEEAAASRSEPTSPSNAPFPYDLGRFPLVTPYDNVTAQHRLRTQGLGIERARLVYGWSMGGQQAYHRGVLFPEAVERRPTGYTLR